MTVEGASGRVFVAEPATGAIDVFSAGGSFETQFGENLQPTAVAVDEETRDVYVASEEKVAVFEPTGSGTYELLSQWTGAGTPSQEFGQVGGVAIDNSSNAEDPHAGDVYVASATDDLVDVLKPQPAGAAESAEGTFVSTLSGGKLEEPNGVAVDRTNGEVYVADSAQGAFDAYSSTGVFERKVTGSSSPQGRFSGKEEGETGNVSALAVEAATGDVYVAEGERHVVSQFNAAGEWVGWITAAPTGTLVEPAGVALSPDGSVYVADTGAAVVDLFGTGAVVPNATTGKASEVGKTSVILGGVVDGAGKAARYRFEWGSTEAYGASTPSQSAAGVGEESIEAEVAGLSPDTSYHYRLIVENENGANVGVDRQFTTLPAVESLSTGSPQQITPTGATLTGALTPKGVESYYYFQWGVSGSYGRTSPAPPGTDAGSGREAVAASTKLVGLAPNTTYDYRLVGDDSYGVTLGEDAHFTTSGPPRIASEPPSKLEHEAATIGAKLDPDELETEYRFQYGETASYGSETPASKLAAGETPIAVSATLSGLKLGSAYHYRLVAANSAGTVYERDQTFTTVPTALIEATSAVEVQASAATLQAEIDPLGRETKYYFQYGTQPCRPAPGSCTEVPGSSSLAGETAQHVSQRVGELQPASTYYYRVVAVNSLGTSEGPEQVLTTQPVRTPFALPDHRAWEMVTPPNKHGIPVEALTHEGGLILAAEDGDAITYVADGPITEEPDQPQGNRNPEMQQVLARRTSDGWRSQDISTPNGKAYGVSGGVAPEYQFFSPDLSLALVEPIGAEPPLVPGVSQKTIYLRDDEDSDYTPIVSEADVPPGTEFANRIRFLTATPDLAHVVLESGVALSGPPANKGLYEWSEGSLKFVSMLPGGTPASSPEAGFQDRVLAHAISSDGTRVVWTNKDENSGAGHLYLTDTATGQTIQLDAAQGESEPDTGSAEFQAASADDSKVFFTDKQRLTEESSASTEALHETADLYECEIAEKEGRLSCDLKDLTVDSNADEHAAVQGMIFGASEDGSSVYLVAQGVLASNENGNGEIAEAGRYNLYALQEQTDGEWARTFIAQLAAEDMPEWDEGKTVIPADSAFSTARVSPNGRYLAFMSAASITGYDNVDASPAADGARDEEVYLYDTETSSLRCVSCNPTGARPAGVFDTEEAGEGVGLLVDRRKVWTGHWVAGNIPGWTAHSEISALFQSRYLSNEGRLFFNSADALVPQVTTATRQETIDGAKQEVGVENVYEYEPSGLGSCESATGGCVSLISSGESGEESAFLEATPSGDDVFFLTAAQLLPQDTDTAFDIYDARVCSSESPCLTPPTPSPGACDGAEACRPAEPPHQAPVTPAGSDTTVGSTSVPGSPRPSAGVKSSTASKPKPLTRAQQLADALAACRKHFPHANKRRVRCEDQARKKYASVRDARKTLEASRSSRADADRGRRR
jgi:sugar lactone lactonase YvrE